MLNVKRDRRTAVGDAFGVSTRGDTSELHERKKQNANRTRGTSSPPGGVENWVIGVVFCSSPSAVKRSNDKIKSNPNGESGNVDLKNVTFMCWSR